MSNYQALIGFDVETLPFSQGFLRTPIVAGAFCIANRAEDTEVLLREDMENALRVMLLEGRCVGATIAFDMVRVMVSFPHLTPLIFQAYAEHRIHDVGINEGLNNLATVGDVSVDGSLPNLNELTVKYLGLDRADAKTNEKAWRVRYHELEGVPLALWPADALLYLKQDAWGARAVWQRQEHAPTEWLHTAAAFCYQLMTTEGLHVDRKLKRRLQRQVEKELSPTALPLLYEGENPIVFKAQPPVPHKLGHKIHVEGCPKKECPCPPKLLAAKPEKLNKKNGLVPLILKICSENHMEVPMTKGTEKGGWENQQVKTDEETIASLAGLDPCMGQYHKRCEKDKLRTSYFPAMEWPYGSKRTARKIYAGYEPLKETGRGSSRGVSKRNHKGCSCYEGIPCAKSTYASQNIQQADPRVRACYLPGPEGSDEWVYVVADFKAIDLVCLAQTVYKLFGKSELRDQLNKGYDPHAYLAAEIALVKVPWFRGTLAGKAPYAAFCALKKAPHEKGCKQKIDKSWVCRPNCKPGTYAKWRQLAKKVGLGFAGGMGINRFISLVAQDLHVKLTKAEAKFLKKLWFRVYPEMKRYLDWVVKQVDGNSSGDYNLCYTSPLGMKRTGCNYTKAANGNALQTPAAEGMKISMFLIARECYDWTRKSVLFGTRLAFNMHDELGGKTRRAEAAVMDARAKRWGQLMVKGQRVICPDVAVVADPFLTTRWVKDAKQKKNDLGQIVPWTWGVDE